MQCLVPSDSSFGAIDQLPAGIIPFLDHLPLIMEYALRLVMGMCTSVTQKTGQRPLPPHVQPDMSGRLICRILCSPDFVCELTLVVPGNPGLPGCLLYDCVVALIAVSSYLIGDPCKAELTFTLQV